MILDSGTAPAIATTAGILALLRGGGDIASNLAIGDGTLKNNTTGADSIALGPNALERNTTGYQNIAIGTLALSGNKLGFGNLVMGYRAGETMDIPSEPITNCANNGSGEIRVTAVGHGFWPNGYIIEVDVTGVTGTVEANGSWVATVVDANTLDLNGSAFVHAYTGGGTVTGTTYYAGWNVALGSYSMQHVTNAYQNVAVGVNTMLFTTTGTFHTAVGYGALENNVRGYQHTAIGCLALVGGSNDNFFRNTAVGFAALGALGDFTIVGNANSYENTAVGFNTGQIIQNGTQNAFYGAYAGNSLLSGDRNTALGTDALEGAAAVPFSSFDNIVIGYGAADAFRSGHSNTIIGSMVVPAAMTSLLLIGTGEGGATAQRIMASLTDVAFGRGALSSLVVGVGGANTAVGSFSLSTTTGSANVALGSWAGHYEAGSDSFYVNNQDRTDTAGDKSKSLMYGKFDANPLNQTLQVNGKFGMNGATPQAPAVLTAAATDLPTVIALANSLAAMARNIGMAA